MYKQITILSVICFLTINAHAQRTEHWPVICRDGTAIGNMHDDVKLDTDAEGAYMVDTLRILSRKVEVHIPVFVSERNDGTVKFSPYWTVLIKKEREDRAILEFINRSGGDRNYLEIGKMNSDLCVIEAIMLWPTSTYNVNTGTEDEPDMMPLTAARILSKKVSLPVNEIIVFDNYFNDADEFEGYYLPREYANDIEKCLKFMKCRYQFMISDFEQGGEALNEFGISDRKLKQ